MPLNWFYCYRVLFITLFLWEHKLTTFAIINIVHAPEIAEWVEASSIEAQNSSHFHMALKLEKRTRWMRVCKFLDDTFSIKVNFSSHHNTHYSAYKCSTKDAADIVHSNSYSDLTCAPPPKTENATHNNKCRRESSGQRKNTAKRGWKCGLWAYDVAILIHTKKITSCLQLMAFAAAQNRWGKICQNLCAIEEGKLLTSV